MTRETRTIVLVLLAIAVLAYVAPLLGGATFVGRDHLTHTIPAKQFLADTLRDGRVAEWWPAVDLGVPFAANPNHSALYPVAWLVAVLPMPWGADALLVLHVLLGGLGVAAFARRLGAAPSGTIVGGAAFMLAGFVGSTVVHGGPALTLAWTPWVAWAADRIATEPGHRLRRVFVLATFVAGGLLGGDPSFAIIAGMLAVGIAAVRGPQRLRALGLVIAAHVVGVLLAAVAIVPALYLWRESARAGGISHNMAVTWSMHPLRMLEWVWPHAFGDPNHESAHLSRAIADASAPMKLGPSWALGVYVSIPVIGAAIVGSLQAERRTRALAWLVPAFVVLALGRYTPIYEVYRTVFVPERVVRYPEKYLGGALVLVCTFAALGWGALAARAQAVPKRTLRIAGVVVGALAALVAVAWFVIPGYVRAADVTGMRPALDIEAGITHARAHVVPALAVLAVMVAALYFARRRGAVWLVDVAAVVLVGHLIGRTWELLPTFDRDVLSRRPRILGETPPGRLARPREHRIRPDDTLAAKARTLYESAAPNVAARYGFNYLVGYDQGHSGRFEAAQQTLVSGDDTINDRFGAELEIVDRDTIADRPVLATDEPYGPYALVRNDGARPRAFVTTRWTWHDEPGIPNTALDTITLFGRGAPSDGTGPAVPCTVESPRPEQVDLICDALIGSYAVLLDAWAPGWTATIDGVPARIELAEGLVRAVLVPAGRHTIAYRYRTPGLRLGALVSLATWLLCIGAFGALAIRRRQSPRV